MKTPAKKVARRPAPASKVVAARAPKISAEVRLQALDRAITVHRLGNVSVSQAWDRSTPFMQRRDYSPDEHIMETASKFAHFIAWGMTK